MRIRIEYLTITILFRLNYEKAKSTNNKKISEFFKIKIVNVLS